MAFTDRERRQCNIATVQGLLVIASVPTVIYVVIHFIIKYW